MPDELTYMTDAHIAVIRALERRGFGLMYEVDFPPYRVDIYLPDYHAAVEVDGPRHSVTGGIMRDRKLSDDYWLHTFHIDAAEAEQPNRWLPMLGAFLRIARVSKEDRWEHCELRTPWL